MPSPLTSFTDALSPLPDWFADRYAKPAGLVGDGRLIEAGSDDPLDVAVHQVTSWHQLLAAEGWALVSGDGNEDGSVWRHPDATARSSATVRYGYLFVYSPNTPFEETTGGDPHGISLFTGYATLEHAGDVSSAAQALREHGVLDDSTWWWPEMPDPLGRESHNPVLPTPGVAPPLLPTAEGEPQPQRPPGQHLRLATYEDTVMRRVRWCWDGRIPTASITLLAGREGQGKSTVAFDAMARLTRGNSNGEYRDLPKDVIVVATEDSASHTIKPRLVAAGADMTRVFRVDMLDPGATLSLPVDLAELEAAMADRDVAMVVLDPLLSRLHGKLDSHKDSDVRQALEPLAGFAERTKVAILGLIHLNKSGSTDPLSAIMASRAFVAVARSVLFAMIDPANDQQRLLGLVKSNLGRMDIPTLTYRFDEIIVGEDGGEPITATKIDWTGESATDVFEALQRATEDPTALNEATEWLTDLMYEEGGSCLSKVAKAKGKAAGHSERTLIRAMHVLDLETRRVGFPAETLWAWKEHPAMPK